MNRHILAVNGGSNVSHFAMEDVVGDENRLASRGKRNRVRCIGAAGEYVAADGDIAVTAV